MSYQAALADLKQVFGDKKLLSPSDIAPHIGKSATAQAKLRERGSFPIPIKMGMGKRVVVSIYDLAHYLGDDATDSPQQSHSGQGMARESDKVASKSISARRGSHAANPSKPFRRPPSLGKTLLAFRANIETIEMRLQFERELLLALEAIHSAAMLEKGTVQPKVTQKRKRALGNSTL